MIEFRTTHPAGNPTLPDGAVAPSLVSTCGQYRITPQEARGGLCWAMEAPGTVERFHGRRVELSLAQAIRAADRLATIDRTVELRSLRWDSLE